LNISLLSIILYKIGVRAKLDTIDAVIDDSLSKITRSVYSDEIVSNDFSELKDPRLMIVVKLEKSLDKKKEEEDSN